MINFKFILLLEHEWFKSESVLYIYYNLGKHSGTLVNHLLQDLKFPDLNLDKD